MFKSFKVDNARRVEFTGNNIQIPKSKWAYLRNNIDTFHSTGGEGTPSEPIPIVNVSSWNKTVCGKNLFDINTLTNKFNVDTQITDNDIIITATSLGTFRRVNSANFILPAGTYYLNAEYEILAGTAIANSGRVAILDKKSNDTLRQNSGSFILTEPTEIFLVCYLSVTTALVDLLSIRFYNIQIERSSSYTGWQKYNGNIYSYRLEDVNGILHYGGDLPDGTADTVNWETGEFVERKGVKVLDGTESGWEKSSAALNGFYISWDTFSNGGVSYASFKSNIATYTSNVKEYRDVYNRGYSDNYCCFNVDPNMIGGDTVGVWISYLASQYNAGTPVTVQYALAEPVTYQIKQYGETYGGVVWEYNEKPIQVEDSVCNVFSDKNVKMKFKAVSY